MIYAVDVTEKNLKYDLQRRYKRKVAIRSTRWLRHY